MLLDANIFLELFLGQEKAELCRIFLNQVASGEKNAVVSSFTIDSIIIVLEAEKVNLNRIALFLEKIVKSRGLSVYKPTIKDRFHAFQLIKKYRLSYDDALTLQCAIVNNCKEIVTFDGHFEKVKEVKRIEP